MKTLIALATIFCMVAAIPVPEAEQSISLVNIPLTGGKELDVITLADQDGSINERNKRTIGILRELFPQLSQLVEQKVNMIASFFIRTIGPILLRGGLGGAGGTTNTQSRTKPTDDDDFDDFPSSEETGTKGSVKISLPTFAPDIRRARETNNINNNPSNNININTDQETQASDKVQDQQVQPAENASALDELTLDSVEDDENRNKRFLNFGFGASGANGQGNAAGGSGGSGNFLFDIIRRTADRVARGAGSVYRVVAGTESLDAAIKHINTDSDIQPINADADDSGKERSARSGLNLLVSGSSGTEQTDEKSNAPDGDIGKGDGYTEGIPGPVTRLFVLANRGLSNLIQDLILRIAQTSERVVNFKARLITSLI
ncbi:unnamed protein product [Diamesa serratosioi]